MPVASHSAKGTSRQKAAPVFSTDQGDLFQQIESVGRAVEPVDLDLGLELLGAIKFALRQAKQRGLSVERVVDRMNALLPPRKTGAKEEPAISVRQLYAWTAQSREQHRFPAEYLPAFCAATDCDQPLRVLAQSIDLDLVDAKEQAAKQLGENLIQSARLRRERSQLTKTLGG